MLIKSIISFCVAVLLEFTFYSPVQDALFGAVLDIATATAMPWYFILGVRVIFFLIGFGGTFMLLCLIPGIREM